MDQFEVELVVEVGGGGGCGWEIKLKDEVGMAGSNSTQSRFVGVITSTIHPYAYFFSVTIRLLMSTFLCMLPSVSVLDLHAGEHPIWLRIVSFHQSHYFCTPCI